MPKLKLFQLLKEVLAEFNQDRCFSLSAALSYYTIFSLAPVLIIVIAVASLFLGNETVQMEIFNQIENLVGSEAAVSVQQMIEKGYQPQASFWASLIGLGTLMLGATTVFIQLQDALNTIWSVKPKPKRGILKWLKDRVISFGMILAVGFLLLVSFVVHALLSVLGRFLASMLPDFSVVLLKLIEIIISLLVTSLLFGLIFKFLPDVKITWRDVRVGAVVTAVLFAIGKIFIGLYLGNSNVASAYGAAGAIVIIILWVNYSSLILFFGAEFTQVYASQYGSMIRPADYAVRIIRKEEELGT